MAGNWVLTTPPEPMCRARQELERYAPLVTKGSYLVVQDTYIKDFFPGAVQAEPIEAVEAFLAALQPVPSPALVDGKVVTVFS